VWVSKIDPRKKTSEVGGKQAHSWFVGCRRFVRRREIEYFGTLTVKLKKSYRKIVTASWPSIIRTIKIAVIIEQNEMVSLWPAILECGHGTCSSIRFWVDVAYKLMMVRLRFNIALYKLLVRFSKLVPKNRKVNFSYSSSC
jgi:hypothetical protein